MPPKPRRCPDCHHWQADPEFRQTSRRNRAVQVHICPPGWDTGHTFADCPSRYEKGHKEELDARKRSEKRQRDEEKEREKAEEAERKKVEKEGRKALKEQQKEEKKARKRRLREQRLADVIPEFEEYCREIGLEEEDTPEFLEKLLEACRGFLRQRRQTSEENSRSVNASQLNHQRSVKYWIATFPMNHYAPTSVQKLETVTRKMTRKRNN